MAMKKKFSVGGVIFIVCSIAVVLLAQSSGPNQGGISILGTLTANHCIKAGGPAQIQDAGAACGSGSGTVSGPGSTTVGDITTWNATDGTVVADAGFTAANTVRKDAANTGAAAMTLDMSGSTVANAFKVPVVAGGTSGADGVIVYDSTNKNTHVRCNAADCLAVVTSGVLSLNAIPKQGNASVESLTASSVLDNGTTVGSTENYKFGTAGGIPNLDLTYGSTTADMSNQTSASCTNVTGMTWAIAANKNYVLNCRIIRTLAASATMQYCLGGPGTPTSHSIVVTGFNAASSAWSEIDLLDSATYGTKTTASSANANTSTDQIYAFIQNGATASGTALTLQTAANGTNAITVKKNSNCSIMQVN